MLYDTFRLMYLDLMSLCLSMPPMPVVTCEIPSINMHFTPYITPYCTSLTPNTYTPSTNTLYPTMAPPPEPKLNDLGSNIVGPRNPDRERQNPDMIRSPPTDWGTVLNMKWSFADSHMRLEPGGWAREVTVRELPMSRDLAGTNMRLDEGAVRELHWCVLRARTRTRTHCH